MEAALSTPSCVEVQWPNLDQSAAIGDDEACARFAALLSPAERQRAAGYMNTTDRARYIGRHHWLRVELARLLARPANQIEYATDRFGKPFVSDCPLVFSLSHSKGIALLAIGFVSAIGCDIEWEDPGFDIDAVSSLFSLSEREALRTLCAHNRRKAFYQLWTLKEAFVKAQGQGLAIPLDSFDVAVDRQTRKVCLHRCHGWSGTVLDTAPGFHAAVVAPVGFTLLLTASPVRVFPEALQ